MHVCVCVFLSIQSISGLITTTHCSMIGQLNTMYTHRNLCCFNYTINKVELSLFFSFLSDFSCSSLFPPFSSFILPHVPPQSPYLSCYPPSPLLYFCHFLLSPYYPLLSIYVVVSSFTTHLMFVFCL